MSISDKTAEFLLSEQSDQRNDIDTMRIYKFADKASSLILPECIAVIRGLRTPSLESGMLGLHWTVLTGEIDLPSSSEPSDELEVVSRGSLMNRFTRFAENHIPVHDDQMKITETFVELIEAEDTELATVIRAAFTPEPSPAASPEPSFGLYL